METSKDNVSVFVFRQRSDLCQKWNCASENPGPKGFCLFLGGGGGIGFDRIAIAFRIRLYTVFLIFDLTMLKLLRIT